MRFLDIPDSGPLRRFTDADVFWSLYIIGKDGPISRLKLSGIIGCGEGSTRRIIEYLDSWGFVRIKQTGVFITDEGKEILESIPIRVIDIYLPQYVKGDFFQGIVVKGNAFKITNGMHQRDVGVRSGATGCTTFVIRDGKVIMPPEYDIDEKDPKSAETIRKAADPSEGDVIILGSGNDWPSAMRAAVRAGLDML